MPCMERTSREFRYDNAINDGMIVTSLSFRLRSRHMWTGLDAPFEV